MGDELTGFTAAVLAPGQQESRSAKAALDAWLAGLDAGARPEWEAVWQELMAERVVDERGRPRPRWDWRKALYIAWCVLPADRRRPATVHELATQRLGLRDTATIRHWRAKDPEIDERIASLPRRLLLGHVATVLDALVTVAKEPDPRSFQDRRLFLEMTGQYSPRTQLQAEVETVTLGVEEWRQRQAGRLDQARETLAVFEDDV